MIIKILLLSICLIFTITTIRSQDFQGKAIYQTKSSLDVDFSGSGMPADRVKRIKEMMKSQLEKTYVLTFNKTASIYKEEAKLDQNGGRRGGMRFMMTGGAGSGKYYKNTQLKKSSKEQELSGKNFLIKDDLTFYEWKMEEETKMIGENLCFKATTVIEVPERSTNIRFGRRNNDDDDQESEEEIKMEQVIVTAWYTLSIPVNHGPGDYWGLPGLILEISDGNTQILCAKIVMNPKEKEAISEPTKGKKVTQQEFDQIQTQKMKEMRARFSNERKKSGGGGHFIRIGG
ncbi:MAG: GLPGLI family protein [Lutibacter sp.]|nr:GLPGLI family protein [Lutibacter sp.]